MPTDLLSLGFAKRGKEEAPTDCLLYLLELIVRLGDHFLGARLLFAAPIAKREGFGALFQWSCWIPLAMAAAD